MQQNSRLTKKRSQEGSRNVPKYRKNNKSNKNHDLERVEAKKCLEMSSNVAKNAKVTRIFLGN